MLIYLYMRKFKIIYMEDTFFFPYVNEGIEAIDDLIEILNSKKINQKIKNKNLNFLYLWKEKQNEDYITANVTHFCFPVDFKLKLKYSSPDLTKQLEINIKWNTTKFLFSKINGKNNINVLIKPINDRTTIFVGDERKDFLPTWCKYNIPNKTIIKSYDHIENKIVNFDIIDDCFLPETPFQTNLLICKNCDEINVFTFGELRYKYKFDPILKKEKPPKKLYI